MKCVVQLQPNDLRGLVQLKSLKVRRFLFFKRISYDREMRALNIEKKIKQLRADKDSASVKLHELREIEKTLINKIENETGEKISNDTLYAIINSK